MECGDRTYSRRAFEVSCELSTGSLQGQHRDSIDQPLMGAGASRVFFRKSEDAVVDQAQNHNWKVLPSVDEARLKFELDGTLPRDCTADHLELRVLLEEPVAQYMIGQYAKKIKAFNIFLCWIDIQTYKGIPTPDFRRSKALHIFHKYIKQGGVMEIGGVTEAMRDDYEQRTLLSKINPDVLSGDFFKELQIRCLIEINNNIYQRFRSSEEYVKMKSEIKQSYNRVKVACTCSYVS